MLRFVVIFVSLLLIFVIFVRIPEESVGLVQTNGNFLGPSGSSQRFLNIATFIGTLIYFGIAITLNLSNI